MKDQSITRDSDTAQAAYEAARQDLEQKREEWRRYLPRVNTLEKAIQAAQSEAEAANTRWRERFQASGGAITHEVRRLRKESREAADLVEEYEPLRSEMLHGLDTRKLALAEAAAACVKAWDCLTDAALDAEIEKLAETHGPEIRKVGALFRKKFGNHRSARISPEYTDDPQELDRRFFHRLASAIGPCEEQHADQVLPLSPPDLSDVDVGLMWSPSSQGVLRKKLQTPRPAA